MASEELFHIKGDSPVVDELMFWSIVGHEGLSRASAYELTVLSKNRKLDAKDILGQPFDVVIDFFDADGAKHERHCQGHAVRFVRTREVGRYFEYRITLRSWFWLLTKRMNSRILQEKPVLDVVNAVFEDSPIKRFKKLKSDKVIGKHQPRRYCVQHGESDYQFISRLLEEEGIYYWFDAHDAAGTMLLSDASDVAHKKLPVTDTLHAVEAGVSEGRFNDILRWVSARRFDTGKHAARDRDFKAIRKKIGADIDAADNHELADFESFEYPGGYFTGEEGETVAKIRGEELASRRDRHWALTGWPDVAVGLNFTLDGDLDGRNGDYLIAACTFVVSHPGYEGLAEPDSPSSIRSALESVLADDAVNADSLDLLAQFIESHPSLQAPTRGGRAFVITALPVEIPFRAPRLTPRVVMPGPQSAIVVGPKGEELHVDEFGRVKVQFHWDRYGENNEKSTCWVRVSQPMAGKGWGGYFIPRIGQEVIVDFLNGDPDRPIIVGRMYNDEQQIPYKSPTQSGFKTRSTPGGNDKTFNEIRFEDKAGAEELSIHAELDMSRSVERDDSTTVDRDQTVTVKRDQTQTVVNDRTAHVKNDEKQTVDGFQNNTVGKDMNTHVIGSQMTSVDVDHAILVKGVSKLEAHGERIDFTGQNETRTVKGNQSINVTGNVDYHAAKISFTAGHFDFNVTGGNSTVVTSPDGPYSIMANAIKLLSNTKIDMMTVGDLNATSLGSNTTVLGPNTSGYIGNNSEANIGLNRSTFMGLNMETAMAASMSNFLGVQMDNTAGLKMETVAAAGIEQKTTNFRSSTLTCFTPGAAGPAVGSGAAVAAVLGAVVGVIAGAHDLAATSVQYENAAKDLHDAAAEADAAGLNGLGDRLRRMEGITRKRAADMTVAQVLPGGSGSALLGVVEATVGAGASRSAQDLSADAPNSATPPYDPNRAR